jgi:hypothetical protein
MFQRSRGPCEPATPVTPDARIREEMEKGRGSAHSRVAFGKKADPATCGAGADD